MLQLRTGILWVLSLIITASVWAQDYPNKTIHIITSSAGGGGDFTARQIAQGITGTLGQPVVVDNRAQGILVAEYMAKAPPDGYTISVAGSGTWLQPLLRPMIYDVEKDFAPITLTDMQVYMVAVHPSLPVKSIKELIDLAKAQPGQLRYSSFSPAGADQIATQLFKSMTGTNMLSVPYKGSSASVTALLAGEVQWTMNETGALAPHVKAGKLRGLAVTSLEPTALAPGLPTVAASGVPGYEFVGRSGVFAPAKTPPAIIARLNQEIVRLLNRPDVKERFLVSGSEAIGSTPEQFLAVVRSDVAMTAKVIKEAGIKVE